MTVSVAAESTVYKVKDDTADNTKKRDLSVSELIAILIAKGTITAGDVTGYAATF